MSLKQDIRTIARTKEIEEKADRAIRTALQAEKTAIAALRAIWWITAGGRRGGGGNLPPVSGTQTGLTPGVDALSQAAVSAAVAAAAGGLGSSINPSFDSFNPSSGSTDVSGLASLVGAGTATAADLIDSANIVDSNGVRINPNIYEGGGFTINTIMVKDYITGADLALNLDGTYRLPDGWTSPETPPTWADWELSYYASASGPFVGTVYSSSRSAAAALCAANAIGFQHPSFGYIVRAAAVTGGGPTTFQATYFLDWSETATPGNTGDVTNNIITQKLDCGIGNPGEGANCTLTSPPSELTWPEVGNGILSFINGVWQASDFDTEVSAIYRAGQSAVNFSMGDGSRYGRIEPARNGGHLLYEINSPTPTPTPTNGKFGLLFRGDRTLQKYVSSAEIAMHKLNT
jgi:hypothetical protein